MPLSYEYSMGSVRAREKSLFSKTDIESMLAFKELSQLEGFLKDKGYPEGEDIEAVLRQSSLDTLSYLLSVVPDEQLFDSLILVNDAHNIKSVIKGLLAGVDYTRLFMKPCTVDTQAIETAIKENKYSLLPDFFSEAAQKAYEILAHTADARLADAYIDRACMTAQLKLAEDSGIAFLKDYLKCDIFYRNVKILLRGAQTKAEKGYYEAALCELDGIDTKELVTAALNSTQAVCDFLSAKDIMRSREAMEAFKRSPAAFEKHTENLLMNMAIEKCRRSGTGAEAALGYYLAMQAQSKAVHIIAAGISTGTDTEITRERLREIYG
jgi:V/A-type H+-transporting ATPase subunit C